MKKQVLFLLMLCVATIGHSQTVGDTFVTNFVTYEITSVMPNSVEITAYDETNGGTTVNIPATVDYNSETYDVTSIANLAFLNKGLTSVTLPNSIVQIGLGAFQSNALTAIVIPDGLTSISNNTFAVNQLTSVTIPSNVTSIGNNAFSNNNALASVAIPEGVTFIGDGAFLNAQLSTVTLPSTLVNIGIGAFVNNPLDDVISLAVTPPTMTNAGQGTFTIPSNIDLFVPAGTSGAYESSSWSAFNSITEILGVGDTYVSNFITYEIISINPDAVAAVDYDIAGGTIVNIPAAIVNGIYTYDVLEIGLQAFDNKGLTSVTFSNPSNIVSIDGFSFRSNQLTSIDFPESVATIGDAAFESNQLTNIGFTDNIITIGGNAFAFNQLSNVNIPLGLTELGLGIFQQNQLTSIDIPDNITALGPGAFENNQLTSVTIPSSITNIAARAFKDNPLTSVYSESITPPIIVTQNSIFDSFNSDRSNIHLHIPQGTMGAYVTDPGALWTGFNPVTEDALLSTDDLELANDIKIISNTNTISIITNSNVRLNDYILYSISGQEIARGNESHIPTNNFASGIYMLKLDFDKGTTTKKVVVK